MQHKMTESVMETMEAYPTDPAMYDHWWPLMEKWGKKIYTRAKIQIRSKAYQKSLKQRMVKV